MVHEAVLLIIRRSWVRAPPAPPSLNCENVRNIAAVSHPRGGRLGTELERSCSCRPVAYGVALGLAGGIAKRVIPEMGVAVVHLVIGVPGRRLRRSRSTPAVPITEIAECWAEWSLMGGRPTWAASAQNRLDTCRAATACRPPGGRSGRCPAKPRPGPAAPEPGLCGAPAAGRRSPGRGRLDARQPRSWACSRSACRPAPAGRHLPSTDPVPSAPGQPDSPFASRRTAADPKGSLHHYAAIRLVEPTTC